MQSFNYGLFSSDTSLVRTIIFSGSTTPQSMVTTGSSSGYTQRIDGINVKFATAALKKTDRGISIEPARTNYVKASSDFPNALWPKGATFLSTAAKISIVSGRTAQQYTSDATAYLINQIGITANFGAATETMSLWVEKTATSKIVKFSASVNGGSTEAEARFDLSTLALAVGLSGVATNKLFGYINFGTGPNGGTLLLLVMSFTPNQVGSQRKFIVYPNDSVSLASGRTVTLHHCQHEIGAYASSPIVNLSSTAGIRLVDLTKVSITNGVYDVRYITYDGTIKDKFSVTGTSSQLTLATDVTERPAIYPFSLVASPNQADLRSGVISAIKICKHNPLNIHVLGDSYAEANNYSINPYLPIVHTIPRTFTYDGIGGTSLTQQATRFDSTSQYYGDILIIMDGAINSNTFSVAQTAIDSMVAHLTTSPKKWFYMQATPDATAGNESSGTTGLAWTACQASIKAQYPNNYIDTLTQMQSHNDGSANDLLDIAKGWWPRSLRLDNVHPTVAAAQIYCKIVSNALIAKHY